MDFNLKIQIYVLGLQEPISLFGQSTYKRLHILYNLLSFFLCLKGVTQVPKVAFETQKLFNK